MFVAHMCHAHCFRIAQQKLQLQRTRCPHTLLLLTPARCRLDYIWPRHSLYSRAETESSGAAVSSAYSSLKLVKPLISGWGVQHFACSPIVSAHVVRDRTDDTSTQLRAARIYHDTSRHSESGATSAITPSNHTPSKFPREMLGITCWAFERASRPRRAALPRPPPPAQSPPPPASRRCRPPPPRRSRRPPSHPTPA